MTIHIKLMEYMNVQVCTEGKVEFLYSAQIHHAISAVGTGTVQKKYISKGAIQSELFLKKEFFMGFKICSTNNPEKSQCDDTQTTGNQKLEVGKKYPEEKILSEQVFDEQQKEPKIEKVSW